MRSPDGKFMYVDNGDVARPIFLIAAKPHIVIKLKRVFPKATQDPRTGRLIITANNEVARDLEWFCDRHPLAPVDAESRARLEKMAAAHRAAEDTVARILDGDIPDLGHQEPAITPRGYQLVPRAMVLAQGYLLLGDDVGLGKAQPLDAPVLTPTGFRPMGELAVGDIVVAGDGTPTVVTGIFPQGEVDCYRVMFSDGSTVECNDEHLWRVRHYRRSRSKMTGKLNPHPWKTVTLRQLVADGLFVDRPGRAPQAKWHVPMVTAPDLGNGGERPLDPYLLGALLGDGGFTGTGLAFTTADTEMITLIQAAVPEGVVIKPKMGEEYGYYLVDNYGWRVNRVVTALRDLGLWGHLSLDKFVPESYKIAPAADRLALLQGLMDTDGYAMPLRTSATAQFYSSSHQLAEDVRWLAESLGGVGRLTSKHYAGRERYTVTVKLPQPYNPFRLARKAAVWGDGHAHLRPTRAITAVEHLGRKPMQCISVAHPDRLYVTDRFVVTHNTLAASLMFTDPAALPALVVAPTHLVRQWEEELAKYYPWLRAHRIRQGTPYTTGQRRLLDDMNGAQVLLSNYHKLAGGWADHLQGKIRTVIFDEGHELRTGEGTMKYVAAAMIAAAARYRIACTATPVYNYGDEIWNLVEVIAPGVLGSKDEFAKEWGGRHVKNPRALGQYLRDSGIMLRRTRKEVGRELPPVSAMVQPVETDHARLTRMIEQGIVAMAAKVLDAATDRDERFRLSGQLDMKVRHATGVAKAPYVAEFVRMLLERERKIVLVGHHHDAYEVWREKLAEFNPVMYTGAQSDAQKAASKRQFIEDDNCRVIILAVRSGAGLNGLQDVCSTMVFGEIDWSPAQHHQVIGRLARDGQQSPVAVFFMLSDGGSDPPMADLLDLKRRIAEPINDPDAEIVQPSKEEALKRVQALAKDVLRQHGVDLSRPAPRMPAPPDPDRGELFPSSAAGGVPAVASPAAATRAALRARLAGDRR